MIAAILTLEGVNSDIVSREMPDAAEVHQGVTRLIENIRSVISIDRSKLEHLVAAQIAGGHVILADYHGVGKTSLARALAASIRWQDEDLYAGVVPVDRFKRIQSTVDLLPQDILGYNRFHGSGAEMVFNKGPIFAHFVLCDEINLLTPKTQGSFLEAMEEQAVTVENTTYPLPDPFFIIATMNLKGVHLFPLPAPQLDRFMIRISLGYPPADEEAAIIRQHGRNDAWDGFGPVVASRELLDWKAAVDDLEIHRDVIDYIVACLRTTREHKDLEMGASPRAGVKISRLTRALALVRGIDYVTIDLAKEVLVPALAHRLVPRDPSLETADIVAEIRDSLSVDRARQRGRARAAERARAAGPDRAP